jgi:hypothetical protein
MDYDGTFVHLPSAMNSDDLTSERAQAMYDSLFRLANYLSRFTRRMEQRGFPSSDPLYLASKRAYDAVCMEMVRDGFAWRYVQYDKSGEFTAAESEARDANRGLWADPHPVGPWDYRQQKRETRKAVHTHD